MHTSPNIRPTEAGIAAANQALQSLAAKQQLLTQDAVASDTSGVLGTAATTALRDAGIYRIASETNLGGSCLVRLGYGIASLHPAAAWNVVVSHTNSLLAQSYAALSGFTFPEDPDTQWCGVYASAESSAVPDAESGVTLVSGRWRYASNSDDAQWAVLNLAHTTLGAAFVIVPRSALSVETAWSAIGLRGTGSHTLTASQIRVPNEHVVPATTLYQDDPSGPFALRIPSRLRTALGLASVAVGAANALLTKLAASIGGNADSARLPGLPARGIDRPGVAAALGLAYGQIEGAKASLFTTADTLDRSVESGTPPSAMQLTHARMMLGQAVHSAADAAHQLSMIAGSRACLEGDSVGRLWRDTHIATRHAALSASIGYDLGARALAHPEAADVHAAVGPLAPGLAKTP